MGSEIRSAIWWRRGGGWGSTHHSKSDEEEGEQAPKAVHGCFPEHIMDDIYPSVAFYPVSGGERAMSSLA